MKRKEALALLECLANGTVDEELKRKAYARLRELSTLLLTDD